MLGFKEFLKENIDWTPGKKIKVHDFGKADIHYTIGDDNTGSIKLIGVEPRNRGKGHAKNAMTEFLKTADAKKTTLYLDAIPMGTHKTALKKNQLEDFYKSVGFERNKGFEAGSEKEFVRAPR